MLKLSRTNLNIGVRNMIKQLTIDDFLWEKEKTMNDLYSEYVQTKRKDVKIISYGISDNYVPYWDMLRALIEYIANFYDANRQDFTATETEDGVILEDFNDRGITLEDLVIGNSSSRELTENIGLHGEGAKLGGLVQARNNKAIIIETIGMTIVFYLEYDNKIDTHVLKSKVIPNNRPKGSKVFLETHLWHQAKEHFTFLNDNIKPLNNFIYTNEKSTKNYLYVNTLATQEINSFFSYALNKKQRVNRDRTMIEIPYDDLVIALFSMQDKNIIKQWLSCMANKGFDSTFEYDLIAHFIAHTRKKIFKDFDFSLFREAAKELEMQYIGRESIEKKTCYILAHPEKKLVTSSNHSIAYFCEKFLEVPIGNKDLHFGFKEGNKYFLPVERNAYRSNSLYQKITNLFDNLNASSILKSALLKDDALIFEMKPNAEEKIDLIKGRTSLQNIQIRSVIDSLYSLSKEKGIKIVDFPFEITEKECINFIVLKQFPNKFYLRINNKAVLEELKANILFSDCKIILKDTAFKTTDDKNYMIDSKYHLGEEINACFSYLECYDYEFALFTSPTVVRAFLEKVAEKPNRTDLFEFDIIQSLLNERNTSSFKNKVSQLKKTLSDQFIKVFGSKKVISSSEKGDKKANYNKFSVLKVNPILKNYFVALNTNLSDHVRGLDAIDYDVIEKPSMESIDEILTGDYRVALSASLSLHNALIHLYESTKDIENDSKLSFVKNILPYHHSSNDITGYDKDIKLTNGNYKKIIKEYCFGVFDQTYLVRAFDKENRNVNGLNTKGNIFVKAPFSLGTFIHEYVHFSTDLLDICENFEKTLSFMNVLVHPYAKPSDKELKSFFNDYKKWLGA